MKKNSRAVSRTFGTPRASCRHVGRPPSVLLDELSGMTDGGLWRRLDSQPSSARCWRFQFYASRLLRSNLSSARVRTDCEE
jgi:hypothetical protein